ncbi:MAG: SDR family NAD(P)-dependent oxidoreductase [Sciscionella sp.]
MASVQSSGCDTPCRAGRSQRNRISAGLGSRDPDRGALAADELATDGAHVVPVHLDLTDAASVRAVAAQLQHAHGQLDVLVNNAGMIIEAPASQTTPTQMRDTFEVNVFGVVTAMHILLPLLCVSRAPRIVNVQHRGTRKVTEGAHIIVDLATCPRMARPAGFQRPGEGALVIT